MAKQSGWHGVTFLISISLALLAFSPRPGRAADTPKPVIALDDATTWQPPAGEFHFNITAPGDSNLPKACLGWSNFGSGECPIPLDVRRVSASTDTPQVVTFAASLPSDLRTGASWQTQARSYYPSLTIDGLPLMPRLIFSAAYLKISGTNADPTTFEVAITSRIYAAAITIVMVILAGLVLFQFAKYLGVPGPKNSKFYRLWSVPLRLISTANGWASLSQFQILLWSFVIGGGAVYVMTLTGSLIPISSGTLILLGISGGAAVLTEVKTNQQSQSAPDVARPGPVRDLHGVAGQPSTELLIAWTAPAGTAPISGYIVQYAEGNAPTEWREASRELRGTSLRIVGLQANRQYTVRVCATNPSDNGDWTPQTLTTGAAAPPAASVTNVRALPGEASESSIALAWNADPAAKYTVQFRRADSDEEWKDDKSRPPAKGSSADWIVTGLRSSTRYQFRVCNQTSIGAWSDVASWATIHVPKWSDIITDTDRPSEIDVTRVQMLFFTAISAFFVGLKILNAGTIPEIPGTYVTLMGISNGVYVTAKFVRY